MNDDQIHPVWRILREPVYPSLNVVWYSHFHGEMTMQVRTFASR